MFSRYWCILVASDALVAIDASVANVSSVANDAAFTVTFCWEMGKF